MGHPQLSFCPPPRRWEARPPPAVGLWWGQGLGTGLGVRVGVGGRPRHCSCPFTVSASEAALTRTSAIRLPRCWDRKRGGAGGARGGAGASGREDSPGKRVRDESPAPRNCPLSRADLEACRCHGRKGRQEALRVSGGAPWSPIFQPSLSHQKGQMREVGSSMVIRRNATPMSGGRVWRVGGGRMWAPRG